MVNNPIIYMVLYIPGGLMDFWTIKQLPFQNVRGFKKVSSSVGIESQPRVYWDEGYGIHVSES